MYLLDTDSLIHLLKGVEAGFVFAIPIPAISVYENGDENGERVWEKKLVHLPASQRGRIGCPEVEQASRLFENDVAKGVVKMRILAITTVSPW